MSDLTPVQLLMVVNAYLVLALALFALSAADLVCRLQTGTRCAQRHRALKSMITLPLVLSTLGVLAFGLFLVGMAHGSRPADHEVVLFIIGWLRGVLNYIFMVGRSYGIIWPVS